MTNKPKKKQELALKNVEATIVSLNADEQCRTNDKFNNPTTCSIVMFNVTNTNEYFKFSSCMGQYWSGGVNINDEYIYNHKIGDKAYFKILNRDRLFTIRK